MLRKLVFAGMWLVCLLAAVPLVAQPDPGLGTLNGVVKLEDGTPCGGVRVSVFANEKDTNLTTSENGTFTALLPPGKAIVRVMGIEATATVAAGEVTPPVVLTVKLTGIVVTLTFADPADTKAVTMGACQAPNTAPREVSGAYIGKGRYLFPEAPANATAFALMVRVPPVQGDSMGNIAVHRWQLTGQVKLRTLEMTVPKAVPLRVRVVNEDGQPIANMAITGILGLYAPDDPFWGSWENASTRHAMPPVAVTSDAAGMVDLGVWPAFKYDLILRTETGAGARAPLTISADGKVDITQYVLKQKLRTITQTVFGADGKPVPGATVTASYAWNGNMVLKQATADQAGKVIWKDIPPVRLIVWGERVPAGVLPVDAETVMMPLPPPASTQQVRIGLKVTGADKDPVQLSCALVPDGGAVSEFTLNTGENHREMQAVTCATAMSLVGISDSIPARAIVLRQVYVPFAEEEEDGQQPMVTLTLPLQAGVAVHGHFVTKSGARVPGVSRLHVLPVDPADRAVLRRTNLPRLEEQADGTFTLTTPFPGAYAVLPDLFDETTPIAQAPQVQLTPGASEVAITLPEPLLTVPPGTRVYWTTRCAPAHPRQMTVIAHAAAMPVFAPTASLLAAWCRPAPDRLAVWTAKDPAVRVQSLRRIFLSLREQNGTPFTGFCGLLPLLPNTRDDRDTWGQENEANLEELGLQLGNKTRYPLNLWPGTYLLSSDHMSLYGTLVIPQEGNAAMTLTVQPDAMVDATLTRSVRLKLPPVPAEKREHAASQIVVIHDSPSDNNNSLYPSDEQAWMNLPLGVTKVTLYWPGIGYLRDVALPPVQKADDNPIIALPAWTPGVTVSGTLLDADGKPLAKNELSIQVDAPGSMEINLRIPTDENGKFSLSGVMPGLLFLYDNNSGGWTVRVPEDGLRNLVLRERSQPVRLQVMQHGASYAQVWWLPAGGKPMRLPVWYSQVNSYEVMPGPGTLWMVESDGAAQLRQVILHPDYNNTLATPDGPTLGLTFPLAGSAMPGKVTLIGQDAWQGVNLELLSFYWQPCAMLNQIVGQLDAVPPGTWTVQVETPYGPVKQKVQVTEIGGVAQLEFPGH